MLRSPYTTEFDLLNVDTRWQVWVGVIGAAEVSIVTNECRDNSDCNLNGDCIEGKCRCYEEDGVSFEVLYIGCCFQYAHCLLLRSSIGTHCEVRLREPCRTIFGGA